MFGPVPDANLNAIAKASVNYLWFARALTVLSSWLISMLFVFNSLCICIKTAPGHSMWLFREGSMSDAFRLTPFYVILSAVPLAILVVILPINAVARLVAHSGALSYVGTVLPSEARKWSPRETKRALAATALRNSNLHEVYRDSLRSESRSGMMSSLRHPSWNELLTRSGLLGTHRRRL